MKDKHSSPPADLSSRKGCSGKIGAMVTAIVNFFQRLQHVLSTFTYQYESGRKIFGFPLISVNFGFDTTADEMRHAKGVIAIGTKATGIISFGVIFSRGLLALGGLCFGFLTVSLASIAVVSVSVFGLGLVSVSVFAVGYIAVGVLALGWKSLGIIAIGKEVVGIICFGQKVDSLFEL